MIGSIVVTSIFELFHLSLLRKRLLTPANPCQICDAPWYATHMRRTYAASSAHEWGSLLLGMSRTAFLLRKRLLTPAYTWICDAPDMWCTIYFAMYMRRTYASSTAYEWDSLLLGMSRTAFLLRKRVLTRAHACRVCDSPYATYMRRMYASSSAHEWGSLLMGMSRTAFGDSIVSRSVWYKRFGGLSNA